MTCRVACELIPRTQKMDFISAIRRKKTKQLRLQTQWETAVLPFARRRASTFLPVRDLRRARKPCLRLRLRCDGWYSEPYVVKRTPPNWGI